MIVSDAAATLGALAAGVAGALYLGRKLVRFLRALDRISRLVEHELTNNAGSSMKDDVHGIAVNVGLLQREFAELGRRVETLEALELLGYKRPAPVNRQRGSSRP